MSEEERLATLLLYLYQTVQGVEEDLIRRGVQKEAIRAIELAGRKRKDVTPIPKKRS